MLLADPVQHRCGRSPQHPADRPDAHAVHVHLDRHGLGLNTEFGLAVGAVAPAGTTAIALMPGLAATLDQIRAATAWAIHRVSPSQITRTTESKKRSV